MGIEGPGLRVLRSKVEGRGFEIRVQGSEFLGLRFTVKGWGLTVSNLVFMVL